MSDLEAYRSVVEGLQEQAQACKVSVYNLFSSFVNIYFHKFEFKNCQQMIFYKLLSIHLRNTYLIM